MTHTDPKPAPPVEPIGPDPKDDDDEGDPDAPKPTPTPTKIPTPYPLSPRLTLAQIRFYANFRQFSLLKGIDENRALEYEALLAAYMATGEGMDYCNDDASCTDAYQVFMTTVVNRVEIGHGFNRIPGLNTFGGIMAGGCKESGSCGNYNGFEHWNGHDPSQFTLNDPNTRKKFDKAYEVALDVFGAGKVNQKASKEQWTYFNVTGALPNGADPNYKPVAITVFASVKLSPGVATTYFWRAK
jgi:hypothetical protein